MKKVTQLRKEPGALPEKKKTAAYCRVSSNAPRPQHSLAVQIKYFTELIEDNPEWQPAGIFSDFGISGTGTKNRSGFLEMLKACEEGKIDLILTKSIQRFARNTVDLLETVRSLKEKGIEVFFEKENISSLSADGELMLSILASIAQEESFSTSQNISWAVEKSFEKGRPHSPKDFLGYHWNGEKFEIVEDQARIVRFIFDSILKNQSCAEIARQLNEKGWLGRNGVPWRGETVKMTASNIHYTGVLLLGQNYRCNPLTHAQKRNKGEREMFLVEEAHEPIISREQYDAVHAEFARRAELGSRWQKEPWPFTRKLTCQHSGRPYCRGRSSRFHIWSCRRCPEYAGLPCPGMKTIDEEALMNTSAMAMETDKFNAEEFRNKVESIKVESRERLHFFFTDGTQKTVSYLALDRRKEKKKPCHRLQESLPQ